MGNVKRNENGDRERRLNSDERRLKSGLRETGSLLIWGRRAWVKKMKIW